MADSDVVLGNVYDKYGTKNPVYRALVANYFASLADLVSGTAGASRVLEVGCGEGYTSGWLRSRLQPRLALGLDLSPAMMRNAARDYDGIRFLCASAPGLPFPRQSFDLVCCLEVLEHLGKPEQAVAEIRRVCRSRAVFAVPMEPIWRLLNLARGAYWSNLGDTPGHLQHWSRRAFVRLLRQQFEVLVVRSPFPWTMALCGV